MGRKSLKDHYVEKILAAFEACIEKKGLKQASLQAVAKQANIDRRMISHYIGKREDLIQLFVSRIVERFGANAFNFIHEDAKENFEDQFLKYLFSDAFCDQPSSRLVAALLSEVMYDAQIQHAVKTIYDAFFRSIDAVLLNINPELPENKRRDAAFSIMSLSFGGGWMKHIGFHSQMNRNNYEIARRLLERLRANGK